MKLFRNIAFSALLAVGAFTMVTYSACTKDECKDVICQNGGTCVTGTCSCATGYEGTNCETAVRAKFIKSWAASDKDISNNTDLQTYSSIIVAGAAITEIKISNFSDYFVQDVKATVNANTITIASQQPDNDGYYVEGTGNYNATDKKLTWSYTITKSLTGAKISYSGTWQ